MGSLAYTQSGNLPLIQLASVTGIYGVTFLVTWFAAVVNLALEQHFEWSQIRTPVRAYAGVLGSVLVLGGLSLIFLQPASRVVKVAGVQSHIADAILQPVVDELNSGDFSDGVWQRYFEQTDVIINDLFAKSTTVASGGAKMISWAENPVMIRQADEAALLDRGMALAKQQQIYLLMNYSINLSSDPRRTPNEKLWSARVVVVGPEGTILSRYRKTILVPGTEARLAVSGNDEAVIVTTPHGRISALICYDNDFPAFVRAQVGRKGIDILFDPSGDWRDIDPYHTQMMALRAIENGFSVVRVTALGLSAAYDYQGRTLATMDYFKTSDKVFTAYVPERGMTTAYSQVGDVFGWLSVAGLAALGWRGLRTARPRWRS